MSKRKEVKKDKRKDAQPSKRLYGKDAKSAFWV